MQKQEVSYLVLQSTYDGVEVALFKNARRLALAHISKFTASAQLIPTIQACLKQHNTNLGGVSFICANLGPAPFTTLRTTIVTANGISFVTKLPLVGVNGIAALAQSALPTEENLIVILNAFGKSIYYAIRTKQGVSYGWQMLDEFIADVRYKFGLEKVALVGQGVESITAELDGLPNNFTIHQDCENFPTVDLIAQCGLKLYRDGLVSATLQPLYLKQAEPFMAA